MVKKSLFSIAALTCFLTAVVTTSANEKNHSKLPCISVFSVAGDVADPGDIILDKGKDPTKKKDRDLMPDVTARVNIQAGTIDLELYETGETTVYIINSRNEVVSEDCFYSDSYLPASVALPLTPGRYWIVIDADYIYAEGVFVR